MRGLLPCTLTVRRECEGRDPRQMSPTAHYGRRYTNLCHIHRAMEPTHTVSRTPSPPLAASPIFCPAFVTVGLL